MQAIEPTLCGRFYGGYYTESDASGDIHLYTNALAAACERRGAKLRHGQDVKRLAGDGQQAQVTLASGEVIQHAALVVCAGIGSRGFAAQLGDRVNIYPVKGYSITVHLMDDTSRSAAPTVSPAR